MQGASHSENVKNMQTVLQQALAKNMGERFYKIMSTTALHVTLAYTYAAYHRFRGTSTTGTLMSTLGKW